MRTKQKLVIGNTYPIKDEIRALGGRWDKVRRGWLVPDNQYDKVIGLLSAQKISDKIIGHIRALRTQ